MTHHHEVTAVIPEHLQEQVEDAVDELDTDEATRLAIHLGVVPPDDEPDWMLCAKYGPDGTPSGLVWVLGPDNDQ